MFTKIIQKILPGYCILCIRQLSNTQYSNYCYQCLSQLPQLEAPFCQQCCLPLDIEQQSTYCGECLTTKRHFDRIITAFVYKAPIDYLINALKHQRNLNGYRQLSRQLATIVNQHHQSVDCLIPVPLHCKKQFHRGYNQASLISKILSQELHIQLNDSAVKRVKPTQSQQSMSRKQRMQQLANCFEVTESLHNKKVALVDDVVTTASTVDNIAKVLKQAGAESVEVYALARTPKTL